MRQSQALDFRTMRAGDAEECSVLLDRCVTNPCQINIELYDAASEAFKAKHAVGWQSCIMRGRSR